MTDDALVAAEAALRREIPRAQKLLAAVRRELKTRRRRQRQKAA